MLGDPGGGGDALRHTPSSESVTVRTKEQQIPKQLADTLETILKQIDVLTQTVSILVQRLTMTENKLKEVDVTQQKIIEMRQ